MVIIISVPALLARCDDARALGETSISIPEEELRSLVELYHNSTSKVSYLEGLLIRMGRA